LSLYCHPHSLSLGLSLSSPLSHTHTLARSLYIFLLPPSSSSVSPLGCSFHNKIPTPTQHPPPTHHIVDRRDARFSGPHPHTRYPTPTHTHASPPPSVDRRWSSSKHIHTLTHQPPSHLLLHPSLSIPPPSAQHGPRITVTAPLRLCSGNAPTPLPVPAVATPGPVISTQTSE
jgi:hypothetical protein